MDSASGEYRKGVPETAVLTRNPSLVTRTASLGARRALRSYLAWLCSLRLHAGPFGAAWVLSHRVVWLLRGG